jgi:DNA-binding MarR family transcriptional regulator
MAAKRAQAPQIPSSPQTRTDALEAMPLNPAALDQLIHGRVRLGIVSALAVHDELSFSELKAILETTDGNLSVHARRLEEGGYLRCTKAFEDRIPRTAYRLTETGRAALTRYLDHMEAIIGQIRDP